MLRAIMLNKDYWDGLSYGHFFFYLQSFTPVGTLVAVPPTMLIIIINDWQHQDLFDSTLRGGERHAHKCRRFVT